jgi:hypothetical protein
MALLESNVEQILKLIYQLPLASKQSVFEALREDIAAASAQSAELDEESKIWLESVMTEDLPEYDWGPAGIPEGVPIVCTPDEGIVIVGIDKIES